MNFDDYDKLCVMAQEANPAARLFVASYGPMQITFHWRWKSAEDRLIRGFSYCFHIGEIEAAGFDIHAYGVADFVFADCSRDMGRYS